ncbi:hypothetical protein [Erythrobacter crassostreae]|uniref:Lipoprotein n=1 Tax=Erythrobacter crassostreae TaxID=2828328 RepID=A0A9X1F484_9SPHN|nr:hypothetical protein [Erythrobacter crassostrea]MBV7259671.1 hypothetical protein [Erythrobacter crassostrea]
MSRPIALIALLGMAACDSVTDTAGPKQIFGCYFSEVGEPLHVGRNTIQTENRGLFEEYRFERSNTVEHFGTILLEGHKAATFDRESGAFLGWISVYPQSMALAEGPPTTSINISKCDERFCFSMPTIAGEENAFYQKNECDGAFLVN